MADAPHAGAAQRRASIPDPSAASRPPAPAPAVPEPATTDPLHALVLRLLDEALINRGAGNDDIAAELTGAKRALSAIWAGTARTVDVPEALERLYAAWNLTSKPAELITKGPNREARQLSANLNRECLRDYADAALRLLQPAPDAARIAPHAVADSQTWAAMQALQERMDHLLTQGAAICGLIAAGTSAASLSEDDVTHSGWAVADMLRQARETLEQVRAMQFDMRAALRAEGGAA